MSEPRNVTPGHPDDPNPHRPEWAGWSWTQNRDHAFPWIGLLLVMVGAGLLIQYLVPGVSATTLVLAAISIAFFAGFVFGGSSVALIPALLIGALAVARLIEELNIYRGSGTTALSVAVAFLLIWLIGMTRGGTTRRGKPRTWSWALWAAAIFGLIGFVEIGGQLGSIPELGALWPVAIIVVGVILVANSRRGAARHL